MPDPRLQLLGEIARGDAESLLQRLNTTEIVVRAGNSSTMAQLALMISNLVARLFPAVTIEAGSASLHMAPFGSGDLKVVGSEVVALARVARAAASTSRYVIDAGVGSDGANLYVAADAWTLRVGRRPVTCAAPFSGPAVLAAAAIAAAQCFLDLVPEVAGHRIGAADYVWNLVDYRTSPAPQAPTFEPIRNTVCFGAGAVGSSFVLALVLSNARGALDVVDPDRLSPRNKVRYPMWLGDQSGWKVNWLERCASGSGVDLRGHRQTAATWIQEATDAPELAIAAVDSISGRRQATDALARTTLNAGVEGLRLHVSRHSFGDGHGCLYCPYVAAGEQMDELTVYVKLTALSATRVAALLQGAVISAQDVADMVGRGQLPDEGAEELIGGRLQDVARAKLYAQAAVQAPSGAELAVSAPFVSAMAGALLAAEVLKGPSSSWRVDRRIDVDCSGLPPGYMVDVPRDLSGRCLCHDAFRVNAYRERWATGN